MPPTPAPTDPEKQPAESTTSKPNPEAPLSFVPHDPQHAPVRFRSNRYGEMNEHELVKLLDSIEDERARGRFRESIYISLFFWIAIAWLIFYGPRVLWHAPQLINPGDVLKQRELTQLNAPILLHPTPRIAPKPVDNSTIKRLQAMTREAPSAPPPPTSAPAPSNPAPAPPQLSTPPPPPTARAVNPIIPEAPAPQHPTQPNFNADSSARNSIQQAIRDSARSGREGTSGGGLVSTSKGANVGGGLQVLSDMQGVDFSEYLRRLKSDVYRNWIPLLPEETEPPILKQGETFIVFTILPDGKIGEMHLEASTKDVAIDKAAWGSIVSEGQFPPLPSQFHGPNLMLRFHYIVNKGIGQ